MGLADGCASKASANIGTFSELAKFFALKAVFFSVLPCFSPLKAWRRVPAAACRTYFRQVFQVAMRHSRVHYAAVSFFFCYFWG